MYVRKVDGQEINLSVSGMLWDNSLVMQDEGTKSLWSHILGECVEGPLKGKKLEMLPSVLTDVASWRKMHPDSTMLNWPHHFKQNWKRDVYEKLSHAKYVVGIDMGDSRHHFGFKDLLNHQLLNVTIADQDLVLKFDAETGAAWCYQRELEGTSYTFVQRDDQVVDEQTGSSWEIESGTATKGPLKGKRLVPRVVIPSTRNAWKNFHPDSTAWDPPPNPR